MDASGRNNVLRGKGGEGGGEGEVGGEGEEGREGEGVWERGRRGWEGGMGGREGTLPIKAYLYISFAL